MPHIYFDWPTSQGGQMCLPFFYPNQWYNIPNDDYTTYGRLYLRTFMPLNEINGGTDRTTITITAWMTNVEMSVPTTQEYVPQSYERSKTKKPKTPMKMTRNDEYKMDGPVSSVASSIAAASGELEKVPIIGVFARATNIAATAVGRVAALFGFSRPAQLEDITPYKSLPMGAMAQTSGKDLVLKLTTDPKQELSIDPRTVGLDPTDELDLKYLCGRESYIGQFTWATTDAPDTNLVRMRVTPRLTSPEGFARSTSAGGVVYNDFQPSSLYFWSRPFEQWSGTLKFRFQIMASQFHRGRLLIIYDPEGDDPSITDPYNVAYSKIVDLAAGRDFTLEIPWCQQQAYRDVDTTGTILSEKSRSNVGDLWTTNVAGAALSGASDNGILRIMVLNEIVVPGGSDDVKINVFVSAGDDYELANPSSERVWRTTIWQPQSQEQDIKVATEDAPEEGEPLTIIEDISHDPVLYKPMVFYGEKISSFRQMLKRYVWAYSLQNEVSPTSSTGVYDLYKAGLMMIPPFMGYDPNGFWTATGPVNFNYTGVTFYQYCMLGFVGWRGGVRYKVMPRSVEGSGLLQVRRRTNDKNYNFSLLSQAVGTATSGGLAAQRYMSLLTGAESGIALTEFRNMPGLEFEIPYHTAYRFSLVSRYITTSTINFGERNLGFDLVTECSYPNPEVGGLHLYSAAAEDFTLFFYIGAPRFYILQDSIPTGV
jgi:hypothetical protein